MTSSNCYSSLYPFPIDLNEDDQHQKHQLFSLNPPPSSSSSLTCPNLFFNPAVHEHQAGYYQSRVQNQHFPPQEDQAKVYVPLGKPLESDSHVLKLSIWKKEEEEDEEERNGSHQNENSSAKWMSSKMRMMRKTMSSDHADNLSNSSGPKFEDQKQQLISLSPDNSCSNSSYNVNNSCNTIRVCADCNTTKTPLWRSGPRGPKSLCNACGIRQRKARRAMAAAAAVAAAASVNGSAVAAEKTPSGNKSKVQQKAKRSSNNGCHQQLKNQIKKSKLISSQSHHDQYQGRKKLCFEELRIILSKNSAFHRVFPQDEKDAAILLMALSYGLVHG